MRRGVEHAGLRIERRSVPVRRTPGSRHHDRAVGRLVRQRRRREDRTGDVLIHDPERLGPELGREVDQVVLGQAPAVEPGRASQLAGLPGRIASPWPRTSH